MQIDQPFTANPGAYASTAPMQEAPEISEIEEQMFEQMMAQTMSEMEKRTAEIKESLEKSSDDA